MAEPDFSVHDDMPDTVYEETVEGTKSLPHSPEAEQAVLGGLMLANQHFDAIAEVLRADDFYRDANRQIFQNISFLAEANKPFDIITLAEELSRRDELTRVGGMDYLSTLATSTPSAANIKVYGQIVREHSTIRQLISVASEISRSSYNPSGLDANDLLQLAEKRLLEVAEGRPKEGGLEHLDTLMKQTIERIKTLFQSKSDITGQL